MGALVRAALVDYGAGNLRSVARALERSGFAVDVTSDPAVIARADGVVLPGVGALRDAMERLRASGLEEACLRAIEDGRPYLGLCLGLQLLFEEGDEHGVTRAFGVLRGRVERFPKSDEQGRPLRVPHIGWNEVQFSQPASGPHPMVERLPEHDWFYFVHSYRPVPLDPGIVVGHTDYGGRFASAVATDRIFAVQFHPEKSQRAGHRMLDAYRAWVEASR